MPQQLDQTRIISRLRQYIDWHHLPMEIDKKGICHGLSSVYIKYVLEGKQQGFIKILEYISKGAINTPLDDEINHFATNVVLSQSPAKYDKNLNQFVSMETLPVNHQRIRPAFQLTFATYKSNWVQILEGIKLRPNEAMRVSNMMHTIAISKERNKYVIYDPNYETGTKTFSSEKELIEELKQVFNYDKSVIGLHLQIYRNPIDHTPRLFPSIKKIYSEYAKKLNQLFLNVQYKNGVFNTLKETIILNDPFNLKMLLKYVMVDRKSLFNALKEAAIHNRDNKILLQLLSALDIKNCHYFTEEERDTISQIFMLTLMKGKEELFNTLDSYPSLASIFKSHVSKACAINIAMQSNDPHMLLRMFDYFTTGNTGIFDQIRGRDAIENAIHYGAPRCIHTLINRLKDQNISLSPEQYLYYLTYAIQRNQPQAAAVFIQELTDLDLARLSIKVRTAEKIDLSILSALKKRGVVFTPHVEAIYLKKQKQCIGVITEVGIAIKKFVEFIKEELLDCKSMEPSFSNRGFFAPQRDHTHTKTHSGAIHRYE